MVNGLLPITAGSMTLYGEDLAHVSKPKLRELRRERVSMVFQNFALLPHRTVGENAAYGLEIQGVGSRVLSKGPKQLEFNLGFSHPVIVDAPEGITFAVENPTKFSVQGIDKQVVGETAANIRKIRKPEPYKGKGVRYEGENVRRKVGKAGK